MRTGQRKLEQQLDRVEMATDRSELITLWQSLYVQSPPSYLSLKLMKLAVAYRLQEKARGSLSPISCKHLLNVVNRGSEKAGQPEGIVKPGMRFLRQWRGKIYEAMVEPKGVVVNGEHFKSLSQAAESITGVHWSGPRFFGMRKVKSK